MFINGMENQLLAWQFPLLIPALPFVGIEIDTDLHMRAYAQQERILQYLHLRNMNPPLVLSTAANTTGEIIFCDSAVNYVLWNSII